MRHDLPTVIQVKNLTKRYGSLIAINDISFNVSKGTCFGLIGLNGAGKTTTVNMLTGLAVPTKGEIQLFGKDLSKYDLEIKRRIGVMASDLGLYEGLTGEEYLYFIARIYQINRQKIKERINELLTFMDLNQARHRLIHEYSKGMKKKLCLASLFIHRPEILFLDEPFEGIDPLSYSRIVQILMNMKNQGVTIFLTSHVLERVEKLCSQIGIINNGQMLLVKPMHEIRQAVKHKRYDSLEDLFLDVVFEKDQIQELSWLTDI